MARRNIEMQWDSRTLKVLRDRKIDKALLTALVRSGNASLKRLRASTKRLVRDRVTIRAGYLSAKALPLQYPRGRKRIHDLVWTMHVSGREVPLGEYSRRQTKKGVSVEVVKGQRKLIQSAFLAMRSSGRKGIFIRPTKQRYPMGHRLGMSASDTMADGKIPDAALDNAQTFFRSEFERLFALELSKIT